MRAVLYELSISIVIYVCQATGQQAPAQAAADELFGRSEWAKAAEAYAAVTKAEPANGLAWQNLGECLLQLHRYDEAIAAFTQASDHRFRPWVNQVNVARVYAEQGDRAHALKVLEDVAASPNGGLRPYVASATEFRRFQDNSRYTKIIESMTPCRAPEYRQFDFWIGDWEVQDPAGHVVGHNLVSLEQDGCLVVEHWKDSSGMQTGTSFNYYDIRDKKWHQLYIDNSGNAGAFPAMAGELRDNKMVLLTDASQVPVWRWTWYTLSPGRVRQMAEQSTDHQQTWQIGWDSVYVKK